MARSSITRAREIYDAAETLRAVPWVGVLFALAAVSLGAFVRFTLGNVLQGFPFITFFPAFIITAFFCGSRPGAVGAVLGGALAWYYWIPPEGVLFRSDVSALIGLLFYAATAAAILILTAGMHRGFREYAEIERTKQTLNDELERRVLLRTSQLQEAYQQLQAEAKSREEAEGQVRQLQKIEAIGHLTGGIAHDFNNMLAIIIGSIQLAQRHFKPNPGRVERCLETALDGAQRAAQLTARLLAFSRQAPLDPRVFDPNKLVGEMSEMMRRTLGEHICFETVLAGGVWAVCSDQGQLESAIVNLCVNARDAMPNGGKLTVETSNAHLDDQYSNENAEVKAGQYVMIAVTDNGIGMTSEVMERAFDPFYTTKEPGKGTGLGLSQVYGFIKQSGGHVKIYSEAGQGTTLKLYLPRHVGKDEFSEPLTTTSRPCAATSGEIILIVEDEARVRSVAIDALRELGYTVIGAVDAAQALSILAGQPRIDLLFTDIVMPDMNGRELADKALETRPSLKVLFTTGYTRNAIVHNGVLDAGVSFLQKPFTTEQLATKVRQTLDK